VTLRGPWHILTRRKILQSLRPGWREFRTSFPRIHTD